MPSYLLANFLLVKKHKANKSEVASLGDTVSYSLIRVVFM